MSKGQMRTTGFAKAVNEERRQRSTTRSKQLMSTKRQRRDSKYLSPPYVNSKVRVRSSQFKKGSSSSCPKLAKKKEDAAKEEEEQVCEGGREKDQHDDMNMTLSALKAASSDKNRGDAVSKFDAIRKKLEISSFILDKYHNKFKGGEKARLIDDMKNFGEQAEAVRQRIHALAYESMKS